MDDSEPVTKNHGLHEAGQENPEAAKEASPEAAPSCPPAAPVKDAAPPERVVEAKDRLAVSLSVEFATRPSEALEEPALEPAGSAAAPSATAAAAEALEEPALEPAGSAAAPSATAAAAEALEEPALEPAGSAAAPSATAAAAEALEEPALEPAGSAAAPSATAAAAEALEEPALEPAGSAAAPSATAAAAEALEEPALEPAGSAAAPSATAAAAEALEEPALEPAGSAAAPSATAAEATQMPAKEFYDSVRAAIDDVRAVLDKPTAQEEDVSESAEKGPKLPAPVPPARPPAQEPPPVATPSKPKQDGAISNLDLVGELQDLLNALSSEQDKKDGIFVGVNHFEVFRNGKRAQKEKLLTSKSLEEWRKHLAGLSLAELHAEILVTEEGDKSHDVKIGDELLQCRFYGVDFKDAPGDAGDPRAMLLPQVLCGLIFPHQYLYVYAHLSAMPEQQMEDKEETCAEAPELEPSSDEEEGEQQVQNIGTRPRYYPENIYEYPDGSRRVIHAGYYTQDEYMSKTLEEQELLQVAVAAAAEEVEVSRTENWMSNAEAASPAALSPSAAVPPPPPPSPPPAAHSFAAQIEPTSDLQPPGSPMPRRRSPVSPSATDTALAATSPSPLLAAPMREEVPEQLDVAPERPVYELVNQPSPETLKAAANNPRLLKMWPYAATPELCTHEPSDDAPDVCKHSGYAITLRRASPADGDDWDED